MTARGFRNLSHGYVGQGELIVKGQKGNTRE
jgi:hypothetical protein